MALLLLLLQQHLLLPLWQDCFLSEYIKAKETTLERVTFYADWSELSWSGRAQPILA